MSTRLNCFFFRSSDFAKVVTELGQEQNFEATFINIEETTDDDQVQVLLQLSTVPVSFGFFSGLVKLSFRFWWFRKMLLLWLLFSGCSLGGRASDYGSEGPGFESHKH